MAAIEIGFSGLAACYILLILPLAAMLWLRIPLIGQTLIAVIRMTVQLLLVGFYLQFLFDLDDARLTTLWLVVMISVADLSILRTTGLCLRCFAVPLFLALVVGTALPLFFFMALLLRQPNWMAAQYVVPIAGMILGNCLRADIVGIRTFYTSIRTSNRDYLRRLACGAGRAEAVRPYLRDACAAALAPTVASMATVGLVSLPGMMTGVILGGANPMVAIQYQIAIMIAIFCGTAVTVVAVLLLTLRSAFTPSGILDLTIFR
ncbi:MAG: ABC transporter permease [Kiritimatiellae bacterium]|jgi:putative ABC transport system permease protein|nr:ABC transporter permease [Kiritimatiellia bacterium]MDD4341800.1 ABC transporter permease [Kiritimatiellia bacterium]MDY0149933.1 ABC transporter permease [Kiritimatiellia bacterium]